MRGRPETYTKEVSHQTGGIVVVAGRGGWYWEGGHSKYSTVEPGLVEKE